MEFSKKREFGMKHQINADGSTHTTYWDGRSNTRVSYDTDQYGNVIDVHPTNQNKNKKYPERHK